MCWISVHGYILVRGRRRRSKPHQRLPVVSAHRSPGGDLRRQNRTSIHAGMRNVDSGFSRIPNETGTVGIKGFAPPASSDASFHFPPSFPDVFVSVPPPPVFCLCAGLRAGPRGLTRRSLPFDSSRIIRKARNESKL